MQIIGEIFVFSFLAWTAVAVLGEIYDGILDWWDKIKHKDNK